MKRYQERLLILSAKQSIFMDLIVKNKRALGGCNSWEYFFKDDISTSLITFIPFSISLLSKTSLESLDLIITCNETDLTSRIINKLNQLIEASTKGKYPSSELISTFMCNGHTWRVGQCANIPVPYLCVDCFIDTCRAATSNIFEANLIPSTFWYQDSCLSQSKVESSHETWFRILVIDFEELAEAPQILSLSSFPLSKSEIQVNLVLEEADGTVVCAAYR